MKKNIITFICYIVFFNIIAIIVCNAFFFDGQKVEASTFESQGGVLNYVGYEKDGSNYSVSEEEHYITFHHDYDASDFSVCFYNAPEENQQITVWLMNDYSEVIETKQMVWKKGSHIFKIEDVDPGISMISLSIDDDFSVHKIISSSRVNNIKKRTIAYIVVIILGIALFLIFMKTKLTDKISKLVIEFIKSKARWIVDHKKKLLKLILLLLISLIVSFVVLKILISVNVVFDEKTFSLTIKNIAVIAACLFYLAALLVFRKSLVNHLAAVAFFSVFFVGSMYSIIESPFVGFSWDDQIHYRTCANLSHLFDKKVFLAEDSMVYSHTMLSHTKEGIERNNSFFDEFYSAGYYINKEDISFAIKDIVYLPFSLGMILSRGLKLPYHIMLIISRLFSVLLSAILSYFAVKKLKDYGALVVLLIMLIPTNIFMASNFSYDVWLTAWSILGLAYVFSEMQHKDEIMDKKSMLLIPISLIVATVAKQVYFVLALPALFVGNKKFENIKKNIIYRCSIILSMIIPFVLVFVSSVLNAGTGDSRGGEGVNAGEQIQYVTGNIKGFTLMLIGFLKEYLNPVLVNANGNRYLDCLGYTRVSETYILIIAVIIVGAFVLHKSEKKAFPIWYRAGIILLYIVVGALCAVSMYVSYTPVGSEVILGCQGRYIIPALFPTVYVLSRIPVKTRLADLLDENNVVMILLTIMFVINMYGIAIKFAMPY